MDRTCDQFREQLEVRLAHTSFEAYLRLEHPYDTKEGRETFDILCDSQWKHLKECARCRDPATYTDDCGRYEALIWMQEYALMCYRDDQPRFLSGTDPVIRAVVPDTTSMDAWLIAHAKDCPRHQGEYADLIREHEILEAAKGDTIDFVNLFVRVGGLDMVSKEARDRLASLVDDPKDPEEH